MQGVRLSLNQRMFAWRKAGDGADTDIGRVKSVELREEVLPASPVFL